MHATAQDAARHAAAEEAAQADTPREIEADTPGDTHTPPDTEIQAAPDNVAPDTPARDNAAPAGTVSGPLSGMEPSVTTIPPQHLQ